MQRLALALLTDCLFVAYSEAAFWARPTDSTAWPGVVFTILLYAYCAFVFLTIVATFRVRALPALFLAGALFGWLVEGVLVQTMYASLPFSISFTGLAWHALITILIGWWYVPQTLRTARAWKTLGVGALIGLGYGGWALNWWVVSPPATPLVTFAAYSVGITVCLIFVYWLSSKLALQDFTPGKIERWGASLLLLAYFALITIPTQPLALVILPPLAAVVLLALSRNRRAETRENLLVSLQKTGSVSLLKALLLLSIPLTASAIYALALAARFSFQTGIILYLITTPLGFLFLLYGLIASFRKKRLVSAPVDLR